LLNADFVTGMVALAALLAAPARAQTPARSPVPARVAGTVLARGGERVSGAQIRVVGSAGASAVSDDDGRFDLDVLGDTLPRLVVRRIGFKPETLVVRIPQPAQPPLEIYLTRVAQMVATVVVRAASAEVRSVAAEVRERQRTGGNGHFLYRADFEKYNPTKVTDVLRRVPGLMITRTPRNFNEIRLRGSRCAPLFWMDGTPLLGVPFDPDQIPPQTIEAMEIYSGAGLVPPQFQGPPYAQGCGAIVIWTRHGERKPPRSRVSADSIARLVDLRRVFQADEVDTAARIISMQEPEYPDSLRVAGIGGTAVLEFIVTADGKLDKESIGIVSASHPRFGDAARVAIIDATFRPAVLRGRPVAQVFHLPVTFAPR
jgi:TonB family protein